jgi:hypothetical protein
MPLRDGKPADRHIRSNVKEPIPGFELIPTRLIDEKGPCAEPVGFGFRSFNRQWIIPDPRVITQPNAQLWQSRSEHQVYLTAITRTSPSAGPALTFTGLVPDLDHYNGRGGRVFPLWRDPKADVGNFRPKLLTFLSEKYGADVNAEDLLAYIAALAAHPAFTSRFQKDLSTPGLRVPITAARDTFFAAAELGRTVIWLHTFGDRMADAENNRPPQPPRLPPPNGPRVPAEGGIPGDPGAMPDSISYDASKKRLLIGTGYVENVEPAVWKYEVSGKQVLVQWFSYRRKNRERPIIGERREPSLLGDIQPAHWLAEYTTELINVLHVLGRLVDLEPAQAQLLDKVCSCPTITEEELRSAGAFELPVEPKRKKDTHNLDLFEGGA